MDFLYVCFKTQDHSFQQITRAKVTLLEMRKLMGKVTSLIEVNYLSKFLRACFNRKPPIKQRLMTWDVGVLLTYFQYIGNNDRLLCNSLAAKCVLLIMLSTMCRKADIMQLKLSNMHVGDKDIVFHLMQPTKTYSPRTFWEHPNLQRLRVLRLPGEEWICPVTTLESYLKRVLPFRGNIDNVFILFREDSKPAASGTISRWFKKLLEISGVGKFAPHSARSASSCAALLMGVSLDRIIVKAGWTNCNTFVLNYLKPISHAAKSSSVGQHAQAVNSKTLPASQMRNVTLHLIESKPRKLDDVRNSDKHIRKSCWDVSKPKKMDYNTVSNTAAGFCQRQKET